MTNLLDGIEYLKQVDSRLYLALKKFAGVAEEQERRIKAVEDVLTRMNNYGSLCLVTPSAGQTIPGGTWTPMEYNIDMFDQDNLHDTVTNNSRINIKHSGIYFMWACAEFNFGGIIGTPSTGSRIAVSASAQDLMIRGTWGTAGGSLVAAFRHLRANSYVVHEVYHETGDDTLVIANVTRPYFGIFRLPFDVNSDLSGVPF